MTEYTERKIKELTKEIKFYESHMSKKACIGWLDSAKRQLRRLIKEAAQPDDTQIYYGEDGYHWQEYAVIEYDGTKEELLEELWRLNAPKLSDYDCTGQTFAIDIKVAHMTGNRFKVFGYMTVDV